MTIEEAIKDIQENGINLGAGDYVALDALKVAVETMKDYQSIQGKRKYLCPKCKGSGSITVEYNGYPSGLPDSYFVYRPAYREEKCALCEGEGYIDRLINETTHGSRRL